MVNTLYFWRSHVQMSIFPTDRVFWIKDFSWLLSIPSHKYWDRTLNETTTFSFCTLVSLQFIRQYVSVVWATENVVKTRENEVRETRPFMWPVLVRSVNELFLWGSLISVLPLISPVIKLGRHLWWPCSVSIRLLYGMDISKKRINLLVSLVNKISLTCPPDISVSFPSHNECISSSYFLNPQSPLPPVLCNCHAAFFPPGNTDAHLRVGRFNCRWSIGQWLGSAGCTSRAELNKARFDFYYYFFIFLKFIASKHSPDLWRTSHSINSCTQMAHFCTGRSPTLKGVTDRTYSTRFSNRFLKGLYFLEVFAAEALRKKKKTLCHCHLDHRKCHMERHRIEPGPVRWEAGG